MKEPLFFSSEELDRQLKAAKQLRNEVLYGLAVAAKRKFAGQSRNIRTLETSVAVAAAALGVFWLTLLGSPKETEADQSKFRQNSSQDCIDPVSDLGRLCASLA
jgi:hypothetical protein